MLTPMLRLQNIRRECQLAKEEIEQEVGVTAQSESARKLALSFLHFAIGYLDLAERELRDVSIDRAEERKAEVV